MSFWSTLKAKITGIIHPSGDTKVTIVGGGAVTTTTAPQPSAPTGGAGGTGGTGVGTPAPFSGGGGGGGTYDPATQTYTSPAGTKQSMSVTEAKKVGATIPSRIPRAGVTYSGGIPDPSKLRGYSQEEEAIIYSQKPMSVVSAYKPPPWKKAPLQRSIFEITKGAGKVWQTTEKHFPAVTGGVSTIWKEAGEPMQPQELSELQRTFFTEKTGIAKLKAAPRVGFETAKYALFGGLQATQEIGRKGETALTSKGYIWTGAGVGVVSDIIPTSPRKAAMFYGATKAFTYIPKITKTTFTATGGYGLTQAKTPKAYLSSGLMVGIGTAGAVAKSVGATRTLISPSKAYKIPIKPKVSKVVSPIEYGIYLKQKGKIRFGETKLPEDVLGRYYPSYGGKPAIMVGESLSLKWQQKVVAHELIHYKTPKLIRETPFELLPYRARPSEIIAWGLQKRYAKKGFTIKAKMPIAEGTPLRQRATILIKDTRGKYLVHADKPTGTYMTFGGKIEKGESPLKAAKRELYEESGLRLKLKYKETFYSTEQKHYIFEAMIKRKDIKGQLKAQRSEVSGFKWIKPPRYTGATALQPFGRKATRLSFDKKIVRAEDLTIISKSRYPDLQPTKLVSNIPQEAFIRRGRATFLKQRGKTGQFKKFQKTAGQEYGFGSRYDIPYTKLKSYEGEKLTYVHGAPSRIQTQLDIISKGGMPKGFKQISAAEKFKVEAKYSKRGEKVLYFQPPTTASPLTGRGYVGATYLGLYKKARPSYEMGISVKRRSPTIYEYKGELGKDLIVTGKAIRGKEFEAGVKTGTEFGTESYSKTYLAGKKVKIIEITKGKTPKQTKQLQKSLREGVKEEYYIRVQKRPVGVSEVISHGASRLLYSPAKYKSYRYGYTESYKTSTIPYRFIPYKAPTTPYTPYKTTYRVTSIKPSTGVPSPETYAYPSPKKLGFGIPPTIRVTSKRTKTELFPQLKPQPKKYQASLRSKALGITAPKISGAYYKGAGGIAARPIIVTRKRT